MNQADANVEALLERYKEALKAHGNERFDLSVPAWKVAVLHGLVALAMDHPGMQQEEETRLLEVGRNFREFCKHVWRSMGLSEEDAEVLDRLREEVRQ